MGQAIKNLVVLAIFGAGAYYLWNTQFASTGSGGQSSYAENACHDAIRNRYNPSTVRINSVKANANGFVVRGSMTLTQGRIASVDCLTNQNGTVEDIVVNER